MEESGISKRFYDKSLPIIKSLGLELYDLEYIPGKSLMRVFIMDPVTKSAVIEDCIKVDKALSPFIEEADWLSEAFVLEVSSPGVYRTLKTKEHFEMSVGEMIKCQLVGKIAEDEVVNPPKGIIGENKFRGILKAVKLNTIILTVKDFDLEISFERIKKAGLDPDFNI
jgi:ribosome maturation factor RimP